ncbi:hypothetical protein GCM10010319_03950 [Streptomyces blastmyceticus]|uniref:Uncharacterized protein n=1 Tax=Streptomyces blastmyceticus TaxID=68180 RepID=A0ABP3G180_9ACTN
MLIPPLMPPTVVPAAYATRKSEPPCPRCVEWFAALKSAWRHGDADGGAVARREIVAHFDAAHAT